MNLRGIESENFENYKEPALFLAFPNCSFKCDREAGCQVCQNSTLVSYPVQHYFIDSIVELYMTNPITRAVVCGGLEPFDSWDDLRAFISVFRYYSPDPIIIYTGYTEEELSLMEDITDNVKRTFLDVLALYENIIVKFGRYIPNQESHYDEILGVNLASPNQYAKHIGDIVEMRSNKCSNT